MVWEESTGQYVSPATGGVLPPKAAASYFRGMLDGLVSLLSSLSCRLCHQPRQRQSPNYVLPSMVGIGRSVSEIGIGDRHRNIAIEISKYRNIAIERPASESGGRDEGRRQSFIYFCFRQNIRRRRGLHVVLSALVCLFFRYIVAVSFGVRCGFFISPAVYLSCLLPPPPPRTLRSCCCVPLMSFLPYPAPSYTLRFTAVVPRP